MAKWCQVYNPEMYYIGLDVHKKKISYCVKDVSGQVHNEGAIPATRPNLDHRIDPRGRRYPHVFAPEKRTLSSCRPHFFYARGDRDSLHLL